MPIVQVSKKFRNFCSDGYFEILSQKLAQRCKNIFCRWLFFFLFFFIHFRLMAVRVIFDIGRVADKCPVYHMKGR